MKALLIGALLFCVSQGARAEVPAGLSRDTYGPWLESIGSVVSPYYEQLLDWYEEQAEMPLPREALSDPEGIYVTVARPVEQAIEAESLGDVEKGVTYGLETYGLIDAPVDTVLETILFRWGKPVGRESGVTYPADTVFSFREESLEPVWGPRAYRTRTVMRGGGVAKDQNDISSLVVWEKEGGGYVLAGQFFGPAGKTPSTSSMSIIILRPLADGRTEYRVSGRYTGQSYLALGIEFGRKNFGFNQSKIRAGQKEFYGMVQALKNTGRIPERRP